MYKNKKILVVIPARSLSKGIKNKNIIKLNGKPLFAHSINYAKKSKIVDKIIVSTDSLKYVAIAKKYKAEAPFLRSKKLAGDLVPDYPVIYDSLIKSEKFFKFKFDYVVLLRPTSPQREKGLIEKGIKILHARKSATSIRSVVKTYSHPYRHFLINTKGIMKAIIKNIKEPYNLERQLLPKFYFQSGDLEIIKRKTLINGSVSGNNMLPLLINNYNSIDVDNINDLKKINKINKKTN